MSRGDQSTRKEKEEIVTGRGAGVGVGAGTRTSARPGTWTRREMRLDGKESPGTFKVVIEEGQKTLEGGPRQRVASNYSCKTRTPRNIIISFEEPEFNDVLGGTGSGRLEGRRRITRKLRRVIEVTGVENEDLGRRRKLVDKKALVQ